MPMWKMVLPSTEAKSTRQKKTLKIGLIIKPKTERRDFMKKQTAGRDTLGSFAPKFAELNDDVLFGNMVKRR